MSRCLSKLSAEERSHLTPGEIIFEMFFEQNAEYFCRLALETNLEIKKMRDEAEDDDDEMRCRQKIFDLARPLAEQAFDQMCEQNRDKAVTLLQEAKERGYIDQSVCVPTEEEQEVDDQNTKKENEEDKPSCLDE